MRVVAARVYWDGVVARKLAPGALGTGDRNRTDGAYIVRMVCHARASDIGYSAFQCEFSRHCRCDGQVRLRHFSSRHGQPLRGDLSASAPTTLGVAFERAVGDHTSSLSPPPAPLGRAGRTGGGRLADRRSFAIVISLWSRALSARIERKVKWHRKG